MVMNAKGRDAGGKKYLKSRTSREELRQTVIRGARESGKAKTETGKLNKRV